MGGVHMAGWKPLSDELDPDVRVFTERLRRLIDLSGLGVGAVAERTGHDQAAWESYLDARLSVPGNAVVALAELTGTDAGRLVEEWERAERARTARSLRDHRGPEYGGAPGPSADDRTMQIRRVERVPARAPGAGRGGGAEPRPRARLRTPLLYAAGVLGALLVVTAAVLLVDLGDTDGGDGGTRGPVAAPPRSAAPSAAPPTALPSGVRCAGADCEGEDPEAMGCGGPLAATVARTRVGEALVEVRHSATCRAAWARITGAAPGDAVTIGTGGSEGGNQSAEVGSGADTDAYTPMVAVASAEEARACATVADGAEECTGG